MEGVKVKGMEWKRKTGKDGESARAKAANMKGAGQSREEELERLDYGQQGEVGSKQGV
jgi:hypothetical protein